MIEPLSQLTAWLHKWKWEMSGLLSIGAFIAIASGPIEAIQVTLALMMIALNTDLVGSALRLLHIGRWPDSVLIIKLLASLSYYAFLLLHGATAIVYLTLFPSLLLGLLLYLRDVRA